MAGFNHHYIPRFLQRGFAVPGSSGKKIWSFEKGRLSHKPRSIERTGSERMFHSAEVDEVITEQENTIALLLQRVRALPLEAAVEGQIAATLVNHLAPRAAHLRQSFELGLQEVITGVGDLLGRRQVLESITGLDQQEAGPIFSELVGSLPDVDILAELLDVPSDVLLRMLFHIGKEDFNNTSEELQAIFANFKNKLRAETTNIARNGHDKALAAATASSPRQVFLETLRWRVIAAPSEGAILPDCVAVAICRDGSAVSLLLADAPSVKAVVMPISATTLLSGTIEDEPLDPSLNFNEAAARASHRFFLAATNDQKITALTVLIDESGSSAVKNSVDGALAEYRDKHVPRSSKVDGSRQAWMNEQIHIDLADDKRSGSLEGIVMAVVSAVAEHLPLDSLGCIKIVRLDTGDALAGERNTEETGHEDDMAQIASSVDETVAGETRSFVLLHSSVAAKLLSESDDERNWAIGTLVRQLAWVAIQNTKTKRFGAKTVTQFDSVLDEWLLSCGQGVLESYLASTVSAQFDESGVVGEERRQLLELAVRAAQERIPPARLHYRTSGVLEELLATAMPLLHRILIFGANLAGHSMAVGVPAVSRDSTLEAALNELNLASWYARFTADLGTAAAVFQKWRSLDEYLPLLIHVERLMWQYGMIPWADHDRNQVVVSVPLISDSAALASLLD